MLLEDYTPQEICASWWDAEELMDIRKEANKEAKILKAASDKESIRGYENILNKARKRAVVEMARETVLFDQCLMNYALNSKVSMKEAQARAQEDARAVDHKELSVLMKELAIDAPIKPAMVKKSRSKTNLFQEMGARMQRRVRTARGA